MEFYNYTLYNDFCYPISCNKNKLNIDNVLTYFILNPITGKFKFKHFFKIYFLI